jgi:type II secretory pathway pseudopilin PulG
MKNPPIDLKGNRSHGFSLLEIVTLIAILALLAGVAYPIADRMRENNRNQSFLNDLRRISSAVSLYAINHEGPPAAQGPGQSPEGLEAFLERFDWSQPTPFGGQWEWIRNQHGVRTAIAVLDPEVSEDQLRRFDRREDDGSLHDGDFRFISENRYALVLDDRPID